MKREHDKQSRFTWTALLPSLWLAAGCGVGPADPSTPGGPPPTGDPTTTETSPAATGQLTIDAATDDSIKGSFRSGQNALTFEGRVQSDGQYQITVRVNGAVLTASAAAAGGEVQLDGRAEANNQPTQLDAEDHALLSAFEKALDANQAGKAASAAQGQVIRLARLWSEFPPSLALQTTVPAGKDRAWTSLCGAYLGWLPASHDCNVGGDWETGQWAMVSVGERWTNGPGGQARHELFGAEPWWHTGPASHQAGAYIAGDCAGHCGSGCPSGNQTLTQDCLNHDQCVTGNHDLLSAFCDDEFTLTLDDAVNAPVCGGTSADPPSISAWENNNFPNQGVERKTGSHAICYTAYVANFGWQAEVCDLSVSGTTGISKRIEAMKIRSAVPGVSICYQANIEGIGWSGVVCNNAVVGTTGQSRRLEAINITASPSGGTLRYAAQVQDIGWQPFVNGGQVAGTVGQSKRMEAIQIQYCAHSTCRTGGPLVAASCDIPPATCVSRICAADSFCCNTSWDSVCVGEVQSICQVPCVP
jgi:hypothetical protein